MTTTIVTACAEIIKYCHLKEDVYDPRWYANRTKRLWRGTHYAFSPFGKEWEFFDNMLNADVYDTMLGPIPGWHYVEAWSDRYRVVWVEPVQLAVFTYCEGDLTLVILGDQKAYEAELEDAAKCYGKTLDGADYQVS